MLHGDSSPYAYTNNTITGVYRGTVPSRIGRRRRRPSRELPLPRTATTIAPRMASKTASHEHASATARKIRPAEGSSTSADVAAAPASPAPKARVHVQTSQRMYGCLKVTTKPIAPTAIAESGP